MRRKKSDKTKLKEKITKLVKEIVVERDKSMCQHCHKLVSGSDRQLSHVKSKGAYPHLQFDLQNVMILCFKCHLGWWHHEPTEAGKWFEETFPDRAEYLQDNLRPIPSFFSVSNLENIYEELYNRKVQ